MTYAMVVGSSAGAATFLAAIQGATRWLPGRSTYEGGDPHAAE